MEFEPLPQVAVWCDTPGRMCYLGNQKVCPSLSASVSVSRSATRTPTVTRTSSRSWSSTPSRTASESPTASESKTRTATRTRSLSRTPSPSTTPVYVHGLTSSEKAGLACGVVFGTIAACVGAFYYYNHTKLKQLKFELQKEAELRKLDKVLEVPPPEVDIVAGDDKVRLTVIRSPVGGGILPESPSSIYRHKYYDIKSLQPQSPAKSSRPQSPHTALTAHGVRKDGKKLPPVVLHSAANAAKPLHSKPRSHLVRSSNGASALLQVTSLADPAVTMGTNSMQQSGYSELHSPSRSTGMSPEHSPEQSPKSKRVIRSSKG
jgi:hypothetical protein